MGGPIAVRTDAEAADMLAVYGSKKLRSLASDAGVRRRRGDGKRQTAERIVAQAPAYAAELIESNREVPKDASRFRRNREVGYDEVSGAELVKRVGHGRPRTRVEEFARAAPPSFSVYGEADRQIISVSAVPGEDTHPRLRDRAHAVLTRKGAPRLLEISRVGGTKDFMEGSGGRPSSAWSVYLDAVRRMGG